MSLTDSFRASMKDIGLRLRALFFRRRMDEELDEELQFHLEMQARKNRTRGSAEAATDSKRRARLQFGSVVRATEECREARGIHFLETSAQDVRYGLRMLRKSTSFSAVAVVTLAVAIGANAVVFGALNALIFRPLNVPEPETLYGIERAVDHFPAQSYPDYVDLRDRNHSFESLAAYNIGVAALDTGENASSAWIYEVSGNYFDTLEIQPHLGRLLHASDERGPNSAPWAVLSYPYWHSRFQDDRTVVGRTVRLNKHPFTIVGVAPPGFRGTLSFLSPDMFVPIVNQEQIEGADYLGARGNRWVFMLFGHLRGGVTAADATADLNSVGAWLEQTYPKEHGKMTYVLAPPSLYGDYLGRPARAFLSALMLLAVLILLAACANLGSLFAARASDRAREVSLRLALGSSRLRILRQLFTEATLISLIGGAAGLWGSVVLLHWLSAWQPFPQFPIHLPLNPDAKVYWVALLLALASGFMFGAVPVRQILHADPYGVVKSGSPARAGRRVTARDLLLAIQIAICALLVTASFVALRGLARSLHGNFGFEPRNSMLAQTDLEMAGYRGDAMPAMQKRMIETVQALPGVASVGLVDWAPLSNGRPQSVNVFTDDTADLKPANFAANPIIMRASPEYFRAEGTALLAGRDFTWQDDKTSPRLAIVNQQFAREVFHSPASPVGRYFKMQDGSRVQIVGLVEDGKYTSLTEDPQSILVVPILQSPSTVSTLVVRSGGSGSAQDAGRLASAIRATIRDLDPALAPFIQTGPEAMVFVLFPAHVATAALGLLGAMGAMLSVTGIFGLAAYSVSKRKRELGIRIALGAQRKEVLQAALGRAFKLLAFGSVAGLVLGIFASRVIAFIVYQANVRDPFVLAGVVLAMFALGLLATWIPAQRALSISPVILMREQ